MSLPLPDDDGPARTPHEALAYVLRAISQAQDPITSVTLGRYSDSVMNEQGADQRPFYWGVLEQTPAAGHGPAHAKDRRPDTDWVDLAKELLDDLARVLGGDA